MASTPFSQLDGLSVQLTLPDLWQQEAVRALKDGQDVVVDAPTGAGKTRIFELFIDGVKRRGQAVYTVPTRALANDKRAEWKRSGWDVGIATGDVAEDTGAPVVVATLETQRERLIRGDAPSFLVVDEYQLIADSSRGLNYELALALAPPGETQLLLLSGSVGNPEAVVSWLKRLGREVTLVQTRERPVPLDEVPVETLRRKAPRSIKGFWARTAAEVLMADMGPLLIFAPQRSAAERIAKQVASSLPGTAPLTLTPHQERACGKEVTRLLGHRVAYHHSGLPYSARAGVIEPLAKAGQLHVVVATMGLSAGINFSMRSVLVADTQYTDHLGAPQMVAPDELLQMFGRSGRRGLDEFGYVVTTRTSPTLADGAPKLLRRTNEIDWPTLLRVMHQAAADGTSPFDAARALCGDLFSEQRISLGFHGGTPSRPAAEGGGATTPPRRLFGIGPTRFEIFNSVGHWEEKDPSRFTEIPLELGTIFFKNYLEPALAIFQFVANTFPNGRVCKLNHDDGFTYYGKEIVIAMKRENGRFSLAKNIRRAVGTPASEEFTYDQIEDRVFGALEKTYFMGGRVCDIIVRKDVFAVRLDFSSTCHRAYRDSKGVFLIDTEEREIPIETEATFIDPGSGDGSEHVASDDSPASAWRKLGLIEPDGVPTRRGSIFSFFQAGEGLAIAAALEDPSYATEDIVAHLANIRAGRRFENFVADPSERLGAVCLSTFGAVTYEGYLDVGLPPDYGLGAAEAVAATLGAGGRAQGLAKDEVGAGDIERCLVEWLSILRHVVHAPQHPWDRWCELQKAADDVLHRTVDLTPSASFPAVPAAQVAKAPKHRLHFSQFRN